jgi:hypothetical protein
MNKIETKQILDGIAVLDNRKLTPDIIEAWHTVIGSIPFDIATEAVKLAQQDASIKYLEPRHVIAWAKEAAFRLDRQKPKEREERSGDEQPVCKDHSKPILTCDSCCHRLYKFSVSHGFERIHAFAKQEIYA